MPTINLEPTWEACARIFLLLVEQGKDEKAKQDGRDGLVEIARRLGQVREAQKQAEAAPKPKETAEYFCDYEYGDYLLIDHFNHIKAVSGNSDFFDDIESPGVNETDDVYTIVRVIRVNKEDPACTVDNCDCNEAEVQARFNEYPQI